MSGRTAIGGSDVLRSSPNVTSKLTEIVIVKMKPISNEPLPCACQGVGPSSVSSRRIENSVLDPERTAIIAADLRR